MAATTIVVEEDSGLESLSSCNEQPGQMENFVTLFIVVLNRKGEVRMRAKILLFLVLLTECVFLVHGIV